MGACHKFLLQGTEHTARSEEPTSPTNSPRAQRTNEHIAISDGDFNIHGPELGSNSLD